MAPVDDPGPGTGTGQGPEGLLLVGHGSRSPESVAEMSALARQVADALPGVAVRLGYLEMSEPPAGNVVDELVALGCRRIVVLPLMLLAAGHGKSDVPAVVVEARQRHPHVELVFGSPLGVARELVALLGDAVDKSGGRALPLLIIARGTSDPDANAEAHRAARLVAEWTGAPAVQVAFTGVTWPLVSEGLEVMARLGHDRFALAFWFLCNGRLVERARQDVATFVAAGPADQPRHVVDAGYLGPDPRVVPLVAERYHEALAGAAPVYTCDTCAYRAPFPGLEDRVGQAVGVGHSHLALEHREHGHSHSHGADSHHGGHVRSH